MPSTRRLQRPTLEEKARLLAEARGGSFESLGRLLDAYRPFLSAMARKQLRPPIQERFSASDLVQETLRDAVVDFGQFQADGDGAFSGWLVTLLTHNVQDARRRALAKKRDARRRRELGGAEHRETIRRQLADNIKRPTPSEQREAQQRLEAALATLPADYQQVIRAHHEEGLTYEEIGRRMGRSEEAVRKLWQRALRKLQEALVDEM